MLKFEQFDKKSTEIIGTALCSLFYNDADYTESQRNTWGCLEFSKNVKEKA